MYGLQDLLPVFKSRLWENMNNFYINYGNRSKGRIYVSMNPLFASVPWFKLSNLNRSQISLINCLLSNHSKARSHLFSKGFPVDELCECRQGPHSLEHILYECSLRNNDNRTRVFAKFAKHNLRVGQDSCLITNAYLHEIGSELAKFYLSDKIDV